MLEQTKNNNKKRGNKMLVKINNKGYEFVILKNTNNNPRKYRIIHFGIYENGALFGNANSIEDAMEDIEYFTSLPNVYQIRKSNGGVTK